MIDDDGRVGCVKIKSQLYIDYLCLSKTFVWKYPIEQLFEFFFFIYHSYRRVICTNSRRVDKLIPCVCLKRLIKIACDRSCDSLGYYPNISIPILPCVQLAGVYTYLFPIIETDIKRDIYFQFMAPSWTIELFHRNCEFPFNSILKCTRTGMK